MSTFARPTSVFVIPVGVLITGEVKVLFVRVSVPASDAKSASVTAVLNCASVPDTVFEPSEIDLFVSVSVFDSVDLASNCV